MTDTTTAEPTAPADEPSNYDADEQQPVEPEQPVEVVQRTGAVGSVLPDLPVVPERNEMTNIAQLAVTLASANACPKALRGQPNDVFLVLVTARDLGVSLTTAMREFHVIEGTVTLSPKVKLAMVRQSGLGRVWPAADNGTTSATWHAERHDLPGHTVTSTFTWADAQLAHLTDPRCTSALHYRKNGPPAANSSDCFCKSNWKTYPARMLSWRAVGYLLDDLFPEVGTGLYSPDELGAVTDGDGEPIEVRAVEPLPGMRGARGAARNAEAPEAADADTLAALRARLDVAKAHADADADLRAWWAERELPPVARLSAAHARTVAAKLAQVEQRYSLTVPTPESAQSDTDEQTRPHDDDTPADAPAAQESRLADGEGVAASDDSPADGDVAGWLIERASSMSRDELRASFADAGRDVPSGNVNTLRKSWSLWQFESYAVGCVRALSGFVLAADVLLATSDTDS